MKISYTLLAALALLAGCNKVTENKPFVARVETGLVKTETVPVGLKAIGHCVAFNSAEIKAQVEGRLEKVHYKEGGYVEEGELLLTIDPSTYMATLEKAIATRAENMAKLVYSAETVARYQTLLSKDYVSILDFDGYVRDLKEYEAAVMQNDADIRLAQIDLDYCFIKAPFSGICGKKLIDKGNLITNDGSTMVVIKQIDPIFIDFYLPEKDFTSIMSYKHGKEPLVVDITIPGMKEARKAELLLVDNEINEGTGMIPLRAQIKNGDSFFWPGQYVQSNLLLTHIDNAILVPSKAIGTSQKGEFVYVVGSNNTAVYKKVTSLGIYGKYTHVKGDLKAGEKVVVRGAINVKPGSTVEIVNKGNAE